MSHLTLEPLHQPDLDEIVLAFKQIGWHKPKSIYETYLEEQSSGVRLALVARDNGNFCGYVTIKWISDYPFFNENNIPEIADLNVLPEYRKQGIGTRLIQACERMAKEQGRALIGLGVGLTADYGSAQRLYNHLGYIPDGRGIHYKCQAIKHSELVSVDDDLILYFTKNLTSIKPNIKESMLFNAIGNFPSKTPLTPKLLESTDCGSYVREKVEYYTEPGELVRAYILLPKNLKTKAPAIFCHHQHAGNFELGKSEVVGLAGDPDQKYAVELVERGYITFVPDAIAFEERNWSNISGKAEYFELATRLVQGRTLLAKIMHDAFVGLDYLETRSEVDKDKIGFIGHSYGGRMAIWLPAFDKRIKVSVSNCGCVNYKNSLTHETGIQMEFCVPNIMNILDIEDIVVMRASTPLFISATDHDQWSRGAQEIYDYAKPAFSDGSLQLKIWPGEHIFTEEMREMAYVFLDRYLK